MSLRNSVSALALLLGTTSLMNISPAHAQAAPSEPAQGEASIEAVVVTGSRVISDIANSPTPLTVVTTEQLAATTPSDIPTAMNKLPVFAGSRSPTSTDNASSNRVANVLALRDAGPHLVVVITPAGEASPVAIAIDREGIPGVQGTIAGDDTIFVALRDAKAGAEFRRRLKRAGVRV